MPRFTSATSKALHKKRKRDKVSLSRKGKMLKYNRTDVHELPVVQIVKNVQFRYMETYSSRRNKEKSKLKRNTTAPFERVAWVTHSGTKLHARCPPEGPLPPPESCEKSLPSDEVACTADGWKQILRETEMPPNMTFQSRILDPTPGDGALSKELERLGYTNVTNIPEKGDCFSYIKENHTNFDFVVTNPPWSKKFFRHFFEYICHYKLGYALLVNQDRFHYDIFGFVKVGMANYYEE